ncbi:winged helix-turn-helix transcriptional regulator [Plastorhodobacter daqingensis]|uniref:Winged helix-turn-helix transcriptional regulator n=1 Tax=Plastorhodobacter daqingensis TaxID=1387281 RepID=A0ABW2UPV3_9RHOB
MDTASSQTTPVLTQPQFVADVLDERCPSRSVLSHVTSRWGALIMIALHDDGKLRFSALRRRIGGVSERMLTQSLRLLEADGLLSRTAHKVVPPHVDYDLTPLGREVAARLRDLAICIEAAADRTAAEGTPAG